MSDRSNRGSNCGLCYKTTVFLTEELTLSTVQYARLSRTNEAPIVDLTADSCVNCTFPQNNVAGEPGFND